MEKITVLFQPIRFKRNKESKWERGIKRIDSLGITLIDYNQNIICDPYVFEVDWFTKA